MRWLLAAFLLIASGSLARAGELVELTDGTKLTVESHWNDGDQIHLVRGGVDMIVPKARIKSINEDVADPEVYQDGEAVAGQQAGAESGGADTAAEAAQAPASEKSLGALSADELEQLHGEQSDKLLDLQDKRFGVLYGGKANPEEKRRAEEDFAKQNKRNAAVWFALQNAKKAEAAAAASVPAVEQPQ